MKFLLAELERQIEMREREGVDSQEGVAEGRLIGIRRIEPDERFGDLHWPT